MAGFQKAEPLDSNLQIHLFLDVGIAGTQGFDLCIAQCGFVDVFGGTNRTLGGHDLSDELLLGFYQLVKVGIEGVLGDIGVNVNLRVFVALTDNSAFSLLEVAGTPGLR